MIGSMMSRSRLLCMTNRATRSLLNNRHRGIVQQFRFKTLGTSKQSPPTSGVAAAAQKQHVNILEAKAERAAQLHAELEEMLVSNEKRRQENEGFFKFLKKHSTQFGSIGLSFLFVIFAYQIVGMRQAGRKLKSKLEATESELQQERDMIQSLQSEEFAQALATRCAEELQQQNSGGGFWNRSGASSDSTVANRIGPVLSRELKQHIGDAGLTEDEKQQKKVAQLQPRQEPQKQQQPEEFLLTELTKENAGVRVEESSEGGKVIKRQKFSI